MTNPMTEQEIEALKVELENGGKADCETARIMRQALTAIRQLQQPWRGMETCPVDVPVLLFCTKAAGEISGVSPDCQFMTVCSGGPVKADYPGDNWWGGDGDYYATWVWPTAWMPLPTPPETGQ